MDILKKLFPFSFKAKSAVKDLVITIILYVVASIVAGIILFIIGLFPFTDIVTELLGTIVGAYCAGGIVLAILHYVGVIKD